MRRAAAAALPMLAARAEAPPPPLADDPDACRAAALKAPVGRPSARLDRAAVSGPLRIDRSGDPVTTGYSAARLNVETDRRGTILRIACG